MDELVKEIDLTKEILHLEAMYLHYKNLYRKLILLCCSNERKVAKHQRDEYKHKLQKAIDLRCQNIFQ